MLLLHGNRTVSKIASSLACVVLLFQVVAVAGTAAHLRRSLAETTKDAVEEYHLWDAQEIHEKLHSWAVEYSDFLKLTTAQEQYGLPAVGNSSDCPFDDAQEGCATYILTLQNSRVHPMGSESARQLPQVLWNGQVHGNERVGPTAVLEATKLLLEAVACEADNCRQQFRQRGITDTQRQWLARLVTTRRIVILPTANALGYYRQERTENGIDPNRDFPFDNNATNCMQTITTRAINEVVRDHMFQLGLVFHAGAELLGFNWGSRGREGWPSPDDTPLHSITAAHAHYGGQWKGTQRYPFGRIDRIIYTVQGGMEDWAYAGSWDPDHMVQCQPSTYGGYPAYKTQYSDVTLRLFSMLVETSRDKVPTNSLGNSWQVLDPSSTGNGHIPRNLRVALLTADLVEPYVRFDAVNDRPLATDLVFQQDRSCDTSRNNPVPIAATKKQMVELSWEVGGALEIDETTLWYAKWEDMPPGFDCIFQPSIDILQMTMLQGAPLGVTSGTGAFSTAGSTTFRALVDLTNFSVGDTIVVLASARVDQSWSQQPTQVVPQIPPQSHIANVRTNPLWYYESEDSIIRGRLDWFSVPLTIVVRDTGIPDNQEESTTSSRIASNQFSTTVWGILLAVWLVM
jgi:hypothetical protein